MRSRTQVPIRQRGDAIEWLHAQRQSSLPRCFFSARAPLPDTPTPALAAADSNNGNGCHKEQWEQPVSVAGVGSAVFFRGTDPFSLRDWRAIKR
jgi:menaquinone-specific isochorismate synthase